MTTRLLVTADTHHEEGTDVDSVLPAEGANAVVHAGDHTSGSALDRLRDSAEVHAVHGNADDDRVRDELPERATFAVEGVRVTVVHGHRHTEHRIGYVAAETGAHLVVRGHTHTPSYEDTGMSASVLNPGSPTRPKGGPASYARVVCRDGWYEGRVLTTEGDEILLFEE